MRRVNKTLVRSSVDDYDENVSTEQAEQAQESVELPANSDTMTQEPVRTSCGRIVKEPTRYQDFVKL